MRTIEIAFGFPTVVFTTMTLVTAGYWLISLLLGFDGGSAELDIDVDLDSGTDGGSGDTTNQGPIAGILQTLGLDLMPVALVATVVSLAGFLASALATLLFTSEGGSTGMILGLVVAVSSLGLGFVVAGRVARVLSPLFVPEPHVRRSDLVGRICTIRSGRVDEDFGQAEAVDSVSGSHLINVRCLEPNDLRAGSSALIVAVNKDGEYLISPEVDGLV